MTQRKINSSAARKSYYNLDQTNNTWSGLTPTQSFVENFTYDANGNILKANRYTGATWGGPMDSLSYSYYANTNRLRRVRDFGGSYYSSPRPDLDDQSSTDNYKYDSIGNLVSDDKEGITDIKWSVYGKILEINRNATTENPVTKIKYTYDAAGNRISKTVWKNGTSNVDYTWYARDAQGNIMGTYTATGDISSGGYEGLTLSVSDQPLYGSSRVGVIARNISSETSWFPFNNRSTARGLKQYELTNHLGNVLATISDRKTPIQSGGTPTLVDHFDAEVMNAFDYYAGGMIMPDRKFNGPNYRFGFNGKENDNEVKGQGNQQDYGMRIYDPRLGRFLSVDPLIHKYPELAPYQYAGNSPIKFIDIDGEEIFDPIIRYFTTDAAVSVTKNPNSIKSKVYGVAMGVGSSLEKGAMGVYNLVRHPINSGKAILHMLGNGPEQNAAEYAVSIAMKYADQGNNGFTNFAVTAEVLTDLLFAVEGSRSFLKPTGVGAEVKTLSQVRGKITGDPGVLFSKVRAATAGDLSAAAEIRVAKSLREQGKDVHFIDADAGNAAKTGTYEFLVNGVKTEVKRISGLGSNAADNIAKGVRQVGDGGEVIVVRPADSKFTLQQYQEFINNFKPKQRVTIKVVEENSLPQLHK